MLHQQVTATNRATVVRQRPHHLNGLLVSGAVVRPIEKHLQSAGCNGREQAALLCGYVVDGKVGIVTTVLLPQTQNHLAGCHVSLETMVRCFEATKRLRQFFLAQIHTHPGRHCGHSATDDDWAICDAPGFFSIVVPCFARQGLGKLFDGGAAIHERMATGRWRLLPVEEVRRRFIVIPARHHVA